MFRIITFFIRYGKLWFPQNSMHRIGEIKLPILLQKLNIFSFALYRSNVKHGHTKSGPMSILDTY